MKKFWTGAAFAVAALFAVFALLSPARSAEPAAAPYQVEQDEVQLQAPMPAAGSEFASPVQFVPDRRVEVPYGDWLSELLAVFYAAILGVVLALFRKLPASAVAAANALAGMLGQGRVDALLEKAVQYGINATKGAVKDKTLSINVGNEVLERAFEYAIRHAPSLIDNMGGLRFLREKIIARLNLEAEAAVPTPRPPAEFLVRETTTAPPAPPAPVTP